jgi:hypothetical protein
MTEPRVLRRVVGGLAIALALAGCGGQSQHDRQLKQWENKEGRDWVAYANAWDAGYPHGCFKALMRLNDYVGATTQCRVSPGLYTAIFDVPTSPPDRPQSAGRADGFRAGCKDAYSSEGKKDGPHATRFCARLAASG